MKQSLLLCALLRHYVFSAASVSSSTATTIAQQNSLMCSAFVVKNFINSAKRYSSATKSRSVPGRDDEDQDSARNEAQVLLQKARQLKSEVKEAEKRKQSKIDKLEKSRSEEESRQVENYLRYSAEVPILKGDGSTVVERISFRPLMNDSSTRIVIRSAPLPLGLVIGEHESIPGAFCVDDVAKGSNGEKAGVKVGDLLRAVTACEVRMETPTWQLIVGGIGQPKTKRMMYACEGRPFEEVMDAVSSNRIDPEGRDVLLVLETAD